MRRDRTPRSAAVFLAALVLASSAAAQALSADVTGPYVRLNVDPFDGRAPIGASTSLNEVLTDEQQALLGCGPYWGTDCERDGIDLSNADLSVLMQSWPYFEGGEGAGGFQGSLPGSRWVNDQTVLLPGARGPAEPGYNVDVSGCVGPGPAGCGNPNALVDPFVSPQFQSEMAALSWNFLMTLVAFSQPPPGEAPASDEFDPADPMRRGEGMCSFAQPQYCASVAALLALPEPEVATTSVAALLALAALAARARRT